MKLFEEFKLYENMWDPLQEDLDKAAVDQYFRTITDTREAIIKFITDKLKQALDKFNNPTRSDIAIEYGKILHTETDANIRDLAIGGKYGYLAFVAKAVDFGISKYMLDQLLTGNAILTDKITNKLISKSAMPSMPDKPSLATYFNTITSSKEAAIAFIKSTFTEPHVSSARAYNKAVAAASTTKAYKVQEDSEHNFEAFMQAVSTYGINAKYIRSICGDGTPVANALDVFTEITASPETVKAFVQMLNQQYADFAPSNTRQKHQFIYNKWFTSNTTATTTNYFSLMPEAVNWSNFVQVCEQKFGYSVRDLNALFRNNETNKN